MARIVEDIWVEVDTAALEHNLLTVRSMLAANTKLMAVVKANAYGHGDEMTAKAFVRAGADALAVTRLGEGIKLRESGITEPILLFAPLQYENIPTALLRILDVTVSNMREFEAVAAHANDLTIPARIHIKVDTGMGRIGALPNDVPALMIAASKHKYVRIAGIYTHFANASALNRQYTINQLEVFQSVLAGIRHLGIDYGLAHAANSSAVVKFRESHLDMVRPGTLLYGQNPATHWAKTPNLQPTWTLKARVSQIRQLPKGTNVGYGSEYVTSRPTTTAVIPIGFADGFSMVPEGPVYRQGILKFLAKKKSRNLSVGINDGRVPIIGRVAMQMIVVDITDMPGVEVGDEVTIPAMRIPTSPSIPRIYIP